MKRLWGIRHVRYFYLSYKFYAYLAWCQKVGIGMFPQESDLEYLKGVWDGRFISAFHEFNRMYHLDQDTYKKLHVLANSLNKG